MDECNCDLAAALIIYFAIKWVVFAVLLLAWWDDDNERKKWRDKYDKLDNEFHVYKMKTELGTMGKDKDE